MLALADDAAELALALADDAAAELALSDDAEALALPDAAAELDELPPQAASARQHTHSIVAHRIARYFFMGFPFSRFPSPNELYHDLPLPFPKPEISKRANHAKAGQHTAANSMLTCPLF